MTSEEIIKILEHEIENVRAGRPIFEDIQFKSTAGWIPCVCTPKLIRENEYRIKPRTAWCNGVEVPAPENRELPNGTYYYYPSIDTEGMSRVTAWLGVDLDIWRLNNGLVYLNRKDAIARAKAMLLTQEVN